MKSVTSNPNLRFNLLAAALAMALPLGASATLPRSNPPVARAHVANAHVLGQRNRPNAGRTVAAPSSVAHTMTVVPVTSCADGGAGSLRAAIAGAADGDTIDMSGLTCSTITLTTGEIATHVKNLTLKGPGEDKLTIDGNASDRIFNFIAGSDPNTPFDQVATLTDLTLSNGLTPYGGCVYIGGDLTLENVTVSGCVAGGSDYAYGAGLDVKKDLVMTASTVTGNRTEGGSTAVGGGIYVGGTATIQQDSVVSNNYAIAHGSQLLINAVGGGIAAVGGLNINDSVVSGNLAHADVGPAYGGGVALIGPKDASMAHGTIVDSTITGNTATSDELFVYGGGVSAGWPGVTYYWTPRNGSLVISGSTISGNVARSDCSECVLVGGGVAAFGSVSLTNSTLSGNRVIAGLGTSSVAYGGGVATHNASNGTITINQSTVSNNAAAGRAGSLGGHGNGGGVAPLLSPLVAFNSTIAENDAGNNGGGVFLGIPTGTSLTSTIVANNQAPLSADIAAKAVTSNTPSVAIGGDHNLVMSAGINIQLPPGTLRADPQLMPLANYGGPTQTQALRAISPAVDAGANPNNYLCDQRGAPYMRSKGGGVDIGAYERQSASQGTPQVVDYLFVNGFDYNCP